MSFNGTGFSKKLLQAAICVVNKYGLIVSKTVTSKLPMIVNKIITDIVATIGPMEFSVNADKQIESEETVSKDKKATQKPKPKRQRMSASFKITNPSLFKTIKSPVPKINRETKSAKNPSQTTIKKV